MTEGFKMMHKTALESVVEQNTKDIDNINISMREIATAINGIRKDMAERGERTIGMLTAQTAILIKNQTDHEAFDMLRFSEIKNKMSYYLGYCMGIGALISILTIAVNIYLKQN